MAFEIRPGARGPAAFWDGRQLSSAYAPDREAETWADSLEAAPGTLVFVAGDPWGLAGAALNRRGLRAASLVPGAASAPLVPEGLEAWWPDREPLETWLGTLWDRWGPENVRWEVWPAFDRLAPEVSLGWSQRFRDSYRAAQGSWLSQRVFGRRFWTNSLRNAREWDQGFDLLPGSRALMVAASGPSLDDGWEVLARHRERFDLWALPSSIEGLRARGLEPDAVVATDGGFYAREHLHRLAGSSVPVLAALSSAADPVLAGRPVRYFAQGHPVETALLGAFPGQNFEVPSQGTVAVTALRLALAATTGPVFIAGLDLAFRGGRGHARPHTVDRRVEAFHRRTEPLETWWWARTWEQAPVVFEGVRTSPAMLTYAGWFRSAPAWARPVTRIAPTPLRWPSMTERSWDEVDQDWKRLAPGRPIRWEPTARWPNPERRRAAVRQGLNVLATRVAASQGDEGWLIDAARTAVPEALAAAWAERRTGGVGDVRPALDTFLTSLIAEVDR